MRNKKKEYTLEDYMKVGAAFRIYAELFSHMNISQLLNSAKYTDKYLKGRKLLDLVKSHLDTNLFKDCCKKYEDAGGNGNDLCDVFYGGLLRSRNNEIDNKMHTLMVEKLSEIAEKLGYKLQPSSGKDGD